MPRLISRAAMARLARVSRAAITKQCAKQLAPACEADRIDLDHQAVLSYLASKGISAPVPDAAPTKQQKLRPSRQAAPTDSQEPNRIEQPDPTTPGPKEVEVSDGSPEYVAAYADLTLRQLVEQFGTERKFRDWLDALKKIEDIRKTRLDNEETEGGLISRELVKSHVFGAVEAANRRLLGDSPKTIARRIYSAAKSNLPMEEAEKIVRESISSQLRPVKVTAARVLRTA